MTSRRTTTTYAILALLGVRSWTTYELAKQMQRSLNWFWPRAERKLYDEPKELVAAGLATASAGATGKRPKTVYDITDSGREALRRWLDEPSAPRTSEFEAMAKVFFADSGSIDQLRATLHRIRAETCDRIDRLAALTKTSAAHPAFPHRQHLNALCVRLQFEQDFAILDWARWAEREVAGWPAAADPGEWDHRAVLDALVTSSRALLDGEARR